jgi:flagella basal body P-ring formation protein FlgA
MRAMRKVTEIGAILVAVGLLAAGSGHAVPVGDAVAARLCAMYELDTSCYRVELLNNPFHLAEAESGDVTIRPLSQKDPLGLFTAVVRIEAGEGQTEEGQVRMMVHRFADVVVTTDRVASNREFTGTNAVVRRLDVTALTEKPFVSLDELGGMRARRNLAAGTILTSGAVAPIPDMERGREVAIVYVDGLCRITAAGVTMQAGMAGEYIRVKNKASGKIIEARVIDETAVAVDP